MNNKHRQSLVIEKRHLEEALERLKKYTACVTAEDGKVIDEDRNLLRRQRMAMKEYSHVLVLRLEQLPPIPVDD